MKNTLHLAFVSLLAISTAAMAQTAGGPPVAASPPPPSAENRSPARGNAGVDQLVATHGISADEAASRIRLQEEISALSIKLAADNPSSFGGLWVEHTPTFKVVVSFADQQDRSAIRDQVSPALRRYIVIIPVRRSVAKIRTDQEAILSALMSAATDIGIAHDPRTEKFVVEVADMSRSDELRALIPPGLRDDVLIRRGLPMKDAQSGVQSGDAIYGGWDFYDSAGNHNCTFAFVTRSHEGKDAILTASNNHCSATTPYVGQTTHWVILPAAYHSRSTTASGMTYDFRAHVITGLVNGPYVWFENNRAVRGYTQYVNSVPNIANSGYFTVAGSISNSTSSNYGYFVGMPICKMGSRTGLTCGEVTSTSYSGTTTGNSGTTSYSGLVRVGRSNQSVNAFSGDSGGAVFSAPDANSRIHAAGIMKAAELLNGGPCYRGSGYDCGYVFMPIDRVNDVYPMQLKIEGGTINP